MNDSRPHSVCIPHHRCMDYMWLRPKSRGLTLLRNLVRFWYDIVALNTSQATSVVQSEFLQSWGFCSGLANTMGVSVSCRQMVYINLIDESTQATPRVPSPGQEFASGSHAGNLIM